PRAHHPLLSPRHPQRGLHAHRAREGAHAAAGAVGTCRAQRTHPGADHRRPAVRIPACRRHHHRERLLPAGTRTPHLPGHHPARPDHRQIGRDAAGLRRDLREFPRRPRLRRGRPTPEEASIAITVSTEAGLETRTFWRAALGSPSFVAGMARTALIIVAALVSFVWTPYHFAAQDIPNKLQGLSADHWFGTDQYGRDVFSQILVGARTSMGVALVAVGVGIGLGVPLGLFAAAMRGSLVDEIVMRGNDLIFAFPALLIAILITSVFGP